MLTLDDILRQCDPLIEAGAALHWLKPKLKAPVEDGWSNAAVYTRKQLLDKHVAGNNVGIRLGQFSSTAFGYIHLLDVDIRVEALAPEAWAKVLQLIPEAGDLPTVISGSGGKSRHVYFFSEKPLKSRKIFKSKGHSEVFDKNLGRNVKKNDWEIDLYGTGKQVVLPPSIHPDTGKPYVWEREFDWAIYDLIGAPVVDAEAWAETTDTDEDEDDDDLYSIVKQATLGLEEAEIDGYLRDLPEEWVEDRDTWLTVGSALSHEFEGGREGFNKWCAWSRQSAKFDMKTQKAVWKSFKGARDPVTMRSVIQAANETRLHSNLPVIQVEEVEVDPLDDLLGDSSLLPVKAPALQDWHSLMDRNEEGLPKPVLMNVKLIVQHDPRMHGVLAYNKFSEQIVMVNPPKVAQREREHVKKPMIQLSGEIWQVPDPVNGTEFSDSHLPPLRIMIEAPKTQGGYGIKVTDRDLNGAIVSVADENRYHPVVQYLEAIKWDGKLRMSRLFVDYLGCDDTAYHREAAELLLIGAVARVFEPGHKFDFVPILEGLQGKRKSTFINVLGRSWSSELAGDFHDTNKMVEAIQGSWIVEIPELQGFSRADTNVLKAFLSRTHDKARLAYKKFSMTYARQCVFIGSTNDDEYLRDHTGGRRFWPIRCDIHGEIDTDRLEAEVDMIWAEALLAYKELRRNCRLKNLPLFLRSDEAREQAGLLQESRRVETVEDNLSGAIQQWLDAPIGTDSGFDDLDPDAPKIYRNATCVAQIWVEMMGNEIGRLNTAESTKIGKALARLRGWTKIAQVTTRNYGRQRGYERTGTDGRFEL